MNRLLWCVVLHEDQLFRLKSRRPGLSGQAPEHRFIQDRTAGQNPQVRTIGAANERPGIVFLVQRQNAVGSVKRAEEGNFQKSLIGAVYKIRFALRFLPSALRR